MNPTPIVRRFRLSGLTLAVLAAAALSVGVADAAAPAGPRFDLRATVYDGTTGGAVDLVGRIHAKVDVRGSAASGRTLELQSNLDGVTGTARETRARYKATGADRSTVRFPPGPPVRTASFTPAFTLRPLASGEARSISLMVIATLSESGVLLGLEVRSPAPPVLFGIDVTAQPDVASIPGGPGEPARPVARLADALGNATDFVENELTITTNDPVELNGFLGRWQGQVTRTIEPPSGSAGATVYVVRVDPSRADLTRLKADITTLDPTAHGTHRTSSEAALRLFAAAAAENAAGRNVGLNSLHAPLGYVDRSTTEATGGAPDPATGAIYSRNSAGWSYMKGGGPENFGVAEAWRMLAIGGRLSNRVKIGIIDVGCATTNPDFPVGTTGGNDLAAAGPGDPWHCTNVAVTAGGLPDNGVGSAGTGGPVADLRLYPTDLSDADEAARVYDALRDNVKIINMSFGGSAPAIAGAFSSSLETAVSIAHNTNVLVFAAAGNDKTSTGGKPAQDVDHMTCYFICVEEAVIRPCEFDGVTCVGGLLSGGRNRNPNSYYCLERRPQICDVDVYAPYTVYQGVQPRNPSTDGVTITQGTSFSSPYAAGVAALIWAANPSLTNTQIEGILSNGSVTLPSSDPSVTAPVDAKAGVLRAFNGNVPPSVTITAPADGSTVFYGGVNAVHFSADSLDIEEGVNVVDLTWTSDIDGPLGTGPSIDHVFATTGSRRITVTAKDRGGATGTASVTVDAINRPPLVRMVQPYTGQAFYVGVTYTFTGEVEDQINAPQPELCGDLRWTSDWFRDAPFPASGCRPSITFTVPGERVITARYKDADGATGTATATISVEEQPANSPPVVVIDRPTNGENFQDGATIPLWGSAYLEPGETSPIEYEWSLNGVLIDGARFIDFKPGDPGYVIGENMVLTFSARDDDGWNSTSIRIRIAARPK